MADIKLCSRWMFDEMLCLSVAWEVRVSGRPIARATEDRATTVPVATIYAYDQQTNMDNIDGHERPLRRQGLKQRVEKERVERGGAVRRSRSSSNGMRGRA